MEYSVVSIPTEWKEESTLSQFKDNHYFAIVNHYFCLWGSQNAGGNPNIIEVGASRSCDGTRAIWAGPQGMLKKPFLLGFGNEGG